MFFFSTNPLFPITSLHLCVYFQFSDLTSEYYLSEEFCRHHFLVGLILQETKAALNLGAPTRKLAITCLRDLLAKHELDDRYQAKVRNIFKSLNHRIQAIKRTYFYKQRHLFLAAAIRPKFWKRRESRLHLHQVPQGPSLIAKMPHVKMRNSDFFCKSRKFGIWREMSRKSA